jgi:hypothetical protein
MLSAIRTLLVALLDHLLERASGAGSSRPRRVISVDMTLRPE